MSVTLSDTSRFVRMLNIPSQIKIVEVGPRDGLQNEPSIVSLDTKVALVDRLSDCGFSAIEVGSLVSPLQVSQMADSQDVYQRIKLQPGTRYIMLVGNEKGLERAMESQVKEIAVFCSASETFSQKNNNCSVGENLSRLETICGEALINQIRVRGYVSCVLGCPYEGTVGLGQTNRLATHLFELGCHEISLGDTIGIGTPGMVKELIETTARSVPVDRIAVHFHDTYGQALANIFAALESGVRIIDSSVAGLGGCPFAPEASGNVASEDVVYMLNGLGITTGINLEALVSTSWFIANSLRKRPASKVSLALQQ